MRMLAILIGLAGLAFTIFVAIPTMSSDSFVTEAIDDANLLLSLDLERCRNLPSGVRESVRADCVSDANETHANAIATARNIAIGVPAVILGIPFAFVLLAGLFSKPKPKSVPTSYVPYTSPTPYVSIEQQLAEADDLRRKGRITDQEYQQMRQNILNRR